MKLSIIDIGTQSLKHYIFEQNGEKHRLIYYQRHSEANLGESDVLSPTTIERNTKILQTCLDWNAAEKVSKIKIVGTEILRKAHNAGDFTSVVRAMSGCDIEIISQEKEALYLYEGFLDVVPPNEKFAASNIGGGTTELVIGTKERMSASVKLPFGAKFIRKTFGEHDDIDWQKLDEYLDKEIYVPEKAPELFITGVLDFITTIEPHIPFIATAGDLPEHPLVLTMKDWRDWILKLRATRLETLQSYFTKDPHFCDGTTIGHSVYYVFAQKLGIQRVIPSNRDLTDGIIYEMNRPTKH
jgi:exopolyphosphatase/guanosine-5'-triphosphate,3'-diphosphate pyrophosphatase